MIHFKDNKNKSALSTRWAQMSKQEQIIEKKKMEIQAKLEAQKQAAALAAQAKLSNPTAKEETGSPNIFSNDGSFMSQYKALLERQSKDKQEKEVKDKQEHEDVKKIKTECNQKPLAPVQKEVIEAEETFSQPSDIKPERGQRDRHRRWNDRGRNRPHSPMTPVVEDRKKMLDSTNIPPLMQLTVQLPDDHSPPPDAHNQWNSHDGNSSNDEYDFDRQHEESFDNEESDSGQMGSDQMSLLGPGPMFPGSLCPSQMGPGPMCPGPIGHGPMGPGSMRPGPIGPGSMGPGPMGPGPMGPGPMGPGPMGPGPMGPGLMGHGHMGLGPMGPGPMGPRPLMPALLGTGPMGPGPMGPGPMGPGPMGFGPMGPRHMGPGPMGPGTMGPGPMGPRPMGPGPMGPGPMGPGPMGTGPMGPGPMGQGPMGLGPMGPGPMGPGNICPGPLLSGPMGPNPGSSTGPKMGSGSLLGPGPNMPPSPNMSSGANVTSGPNIPSASNIPSAAKMPSGSNIPPGTNMPPGSNMQPGSNVPSVSNIPPGTTMLPETNIPPGTNMPPGPNMPSGPNIPPGPNMSPGLNMPFRPPVSPYMGGAPNFTMPPNFMGPNGPGSLPPNMCGPDVRGAGPNSPMPPFFPPFPNSQMPGSNGPPNPTMGQSGSNFGPKPPFGPAHNFGPNNSCPNNISPPNMPFMPPNSSNTNSESKPSDKPAPDTIKLQNIPPPPMPLNHIPTPKDMEPPNIPAPPSSSQVLSADSFPPTVLRAAAEVATNGDHWENVLKAIHSQDQNLWFLHNPNSNEYKAYRSVVSKMRNDCAMDKKREVKPEDKYEPEFCLEDEDSNDHDRAIKEESNNSMQDSYYNQYHMMKREHGSSQSDDDSDNKRDRRKRKKSRWGNDPPVDIKPPGVVAPLPNTIPGAALSKIDEDGLKLTNINRNNQALMQYAMTNYGTTNLNAEDWKKCEDNFKLNLLYQDMLKKRQEVERLANAGKNKYEYDSDEDTSEGTWEHKLRAKEMNATERWATELTKQAAGKHHIGDFLPPEELKKFMEKYSAFKSGKEPDFSDYKEYKLKEDNVGFKMLQKLGWNEGQGLGAEGTGIVEPINKANQPVANLGLGASTSDVVSADDDEFDAYRKRMMLAYRFRPNPLNNPRRPYY